MKKEKSAGIILYSLTKGQREYLLLHYPSGHFDFPKGHMEGQETEQEAAKRELEEETGIQNFELIPGYRESIEYTFSVNKKVIQKEVVFFVGKTSETQVKISHEHQGFVWLPYEQALQKLTFDNAKNLIKKAEQHLKTLA